MSARPSDLQAVIAEMRTLANRRARQGLNVSPQELLDIADRLAALAPASCVVCSADEPHTGTCSGSKDPRALCAALAPVTAPVCAKCNGTGRTGQRLPNGDYEADTWLCPCQALAPAPDDTARLEYIERTFSGMTNRERYLPVQMIWGKGAMGRTLREACDKYMSREQGEGS